MQDWMLSNCSKNQIILSIDRLFDLSLFLHEQKEQFKLHMFVGFKFTVTGSSLLERIILITFSFKIIFTGNPDSAEE
jgi:hypothetical protein